MGWTDSFVPFGDLRHIAQKDTTELIEIGLRPVTDPLLSTTASTVCHRTRASKQQAIHRLVLRQRQDSGNLSSYEEIWSAKLVVGAYARAPRPH